MADYARLEGVLAEVAVESSESRLRIDGIMAEVAVESSESRLRIDGIMAEVAVESSESRMRIEAIMVEAGLFGPLTEPINGVPSMAIARAQINVDISSFVTAVDPGDGAVGGSIQKFKAWPVGTATHQADLMYYAGRTLSTGANETLDLYGTLEDPIGGILNFAEIRAICILNTSTTSGEDLLIGPAAANGWGAGAGGIVNDASDRIRVPADSPFVWINPNGGAVTAGTADQFYVESEGAADITYRILIIGVSA